jgi:hypothetical protein
MNSSRANSQDGCEAHELVAEFSVVAAPSWKAATLTVKQRTLKNREFDRLRRVNYALAVCLQEDIMKTTAISLGLCLSVAATTMLATPQAQAGKPGGCIKYGAAGAVAGHYVKDSNGHRHLVKGAIAGCVAGMVRRHEYNKHQKELEKQKQLDDKAGGAPPPPH